MYGKDFKKWKDETTEDLSELKEDIEVLKGNISEMENILEKVDSFEDTIPFHDFDIEKGLKHIRVF